MKRINALISAKKVCVFKHQKSILENISSPKDLKILSLDQLSILSDELRSELISSVSKTGGHLGAGLGVIELTIALHYICLLYTSPSPRDRSSSRMPSSA